MSERPTLAWKITTLSTLYFVQGLPAGFQTTALPGYMRSQGASLAAIGLLSALALPWSLKALWAPLVDTHHLPALGPRRSWILPMQLLLALSCAGAALTPMPEGMRLFLLMVLLMNLFAATMDIAVDGLAVDLLERHELGHGNSSQVVGYKVGMLTGGGLLVWANRYLGWDSLLLVMAGLVLLVFGVTLTWREPTRPTPPAPPGAEPYRAPGGNADEPGKGPMKLRRLLRTLAAALVRPGSGWALLYVATYKTGETLVDVMYKPFLIDAGYKLDQIGQWLGTYGMVASLLGSLAGGWLASRWSLWGALLVATALRAGPVGAEWWLALGHATPDNVVAVTLAEHFFGGALTTAVFAFMMAQVDPRIGGTHFTLLATIEVLGKAPAGAASGFVAERIGYANLFAVGTLLSLLVLPVLLPLRRRSLTDPRLAREQGGASIQ